MNHLAKEISAEVVELIQRYGFDLGGYSVNALVGYWMQQYPAPWIRLATIEALYQGRYKAISIEQILNLWRRRNRAMYRFNSEFERMISLRPMLSAAASTGTPASSAQPEISPGAADIAAASEPRNAPQFDALFPEDIATTNSASYSDWQLSADAVSGGEIRRTAAIEPPPIDQFTPALEASDFYWRLKAVVQAMGASTAEEMGRRN